MNKKVVLFNGPPRSGKDTAANFTLDIFGDMVYQYKMAYPLKEACHKILGLTGTLEELEPLKELPLKFILTDKFIKEINGQGPNPWLARVINDNQMTLREFYIYMSEAVMKPLFGQDYFGRVAVEYIQNQDKKLVTISDSGFRMEAMPVIESVGPQNVTLIRVHREGTNFGNDSRRYIELGDLGVKQIDISNNGILEELKSKVKQTIYEDVLL